VKIKQKNDMNKHHNYNIFSTCINPFLYRFGIFRSRSPNGEIRRKTTACLLGGANGGSMAYCDSAAPAIYLPTSPIGKSTTASAYEPNSSIRSTLSTQSAIRCENWELNNYFLKLNKLNLIKGAIFCINGRFRFLI
jgi:hypothetical protein